MKYIRTKDGISTLDHLKGFRMLEKPYQDYYSWLCENNLVIKQSNNIEELCDEFVIHYKGRNNNFYEYTHYDCENVLLSFEKAKKEFKRETDDLFGAIWTDKGLIYVAKMNEQGELELL